MTWSFVSDTTHGEFTLTVLRQSDTEARILVSRGAFLYIAEFLVNPVSRSIVSTREGELTPAEIADVHPVVVKILMALDVTMATPRGVRPKG